MATHRKKAAEVEARKYMGPATLSVVHDFKGQQSAKKGDWLVGNEKGQIEVVTDADFQRDYEPIGDESGTEREYSLGTTAPEVIHPALKPIEVEPALHEAVGLGGETHEGVPVAQIGATLEPETPDTGPNPEIDTGIVGPREVHTEEVPAETAEPTQE